MEIRRYATVLCLLSAAGGVGACGSGSPATPGTGGQTGTGGAGGAAGGPVACAGAVVTPTVDCPTVEIMPPSGTFPNGGVCGEVGEATATACAYDGFEDFTVLGEDGQGDPITSRVCVIRFTVKRVGNAPPGCPKCTWTQTVEYSNPTIMVDVNGACAKSGYALDAAKIAKINGCRVAVGFEADCLDHNGACRWTYSVATGMWTLGSGVTYCPAADAAGGVCAPANGLKYNPKAACTYQ